MKVLLLIVKVENPSVQRWLDNMTYDKQGLIHLFSWSGLIDTKILLHDLFQVDTPTRPIPG